MGKKRILALIAVVLLAFAAYRAVQIRGGYQVALAGLAGDPQVAASLGEYEISYDWWDGALRGIVGEVRRYEFHLDGSRADAVAYVELSDAGNSVNCARVVGGEYLNQHILDTCAQP